jgi:P4 family phage/plasmid primase-like protien
VTTDTAGPDYTAIAQEALDTGSFALGHDDELWVYDPSVERWRLDASPPSLLDLVVNTAFGRNARVKHRREVRPLLLHDPRLPRMGRPNPRLIPFDDGTYDPLAATFTPHRPADWTTAKLPWDFPADPDHQHRHPRFDAFLAEVFKGYEAQIPAVWQIIGYAMLPSNPLQKAVWMYGPTGRNGKGTLLELIRRIVGRGNTSNVSLREMNTSVNQFKLAELHNKIINIDFDASGAFISDTTGFLQVTAGEPVLVERKRAHPFPLNPPGLFLAASNTIPSVRDAGPGYFERWYTLYFPNTFAGHTDPHLVDKLSTEIPAIIETALDALVWVLGTGGFVQTRTSIAVRDVFATRSDNVRAWLDDRCVVNPSATTGIRRLYFDYEMWCRANNNNHKLERLAFKDRLESATVLGLRYHKVNGNEGYTLDVLPPEAEAPHPALDALRNLDGPPTPPSLTELRAAVPALPKLTEGGEI